jgi:alkaline phosphatase D
MIYLHKIILGLSMVFLMFFFSQCHTIQQPDEYYCRLQAGEPTQTSVILLARLQKSDTLVNNDLQGIQGYIKFRITRNTQTKSFMESDFYSVHDKNDYIAKHEFTGLRPGQKYFYSISYGRDTSNYTSSQWSSFKTLYLPESDKNVSFVVASGINYQAFSTGNADGNVQAASAAGLKYGFPAFHAISICNPDFWIENGDDVYFDKQQDSQTSTQTINRIQWHRLFSMSGFNKTLSQIPCFWIFTEDVQTGKLNAGQVPIPSGTTETQSSLRTYRLNRDVQIWLYESSAYYNQALGKNKGGMGQITWLKNTLKESDAPFKLIISSASLINTESNLKIEGQTTLDESGIEKDSLLYWLINNGFRNNGLYFICSNPRLQYHSADPQGFEEFSCGTLVSAAFHEYITKADSLLTNPTSIIDQPYIQKKTSGGFLLINSDRDEYNSPVLLFRFFDDQKKLLYAVKKY